MTEKPFARPALCAPGTEVYQRAIEDIASRLSRGDRIVIGATRGEPGQLIGRSGDRAIVIVRRATRDEFLQFAPATPMDVEAVRVPFYWEVGFKGEVTKQ